MNNRTYIILTESEADGINFNDVLETSTGSLRWNNDTTKTFVKFQGDTPSWLEGKTSYNQTQILSILQEPEWTPEL